MNRANRLHAIGFVFLVLLFVWVRTGPLLEHRLVESDSFWEGTQATYVAKTGRLPSLCALCSFSLLPNFLKQHVDLHQLVLGYLAWITGFYTQDVIWWSSAVIVLLTAVLVYKSGSALFNRTAGLMGLFFVAVSPDSIRYATHFGNNHFFAIPLFLFGLYALFSGKRLRVYIITAILAGLIHSFTLLIMIMLLAVVYAVELFSRKRWFTPVLFGIIILSIWLLSTYNLTDWILLKDDLSANFDVSASDFIWWQGPINVLFAVFALLSIFIWKRDYKEIHLVALGFITLCTIFTLFHIFGNPPRYMTFLFPLHFFSGMGVMILIEPIRNRPWFSKLKPLSIFLMILLAVGVYWSNMNFYIRERDIKGGFVSSNENVNVFMNYSHGYIDITEGELEASRLLYNEPVETSTLASHWRRGAVFSFLSGLTGVNSSLKKEAVDTVISGMEIEKTIDILRNPNKYTEKKHVRISSRPRIHSPKFLIKHPVPYLEPIKYVILDAGEGLITWNGDDIKQTKVYRKFIENPQVFEKIFDKSGVIVFKILKNE